MIHCSWNKQWCCDYCSSYKCVCTRSPSYLSDQLRRQRRKGINIVTLTTSYCITGNNAHSFPSQLDSQEFTLSRLMLSGCFPSPAHHTRKFSTVAFWHILKRKVLSGRKKISAVTRNLFSPPLRPFLACHWVPCPT